MSIMDVFKGMSAAEIEGMFDSLDDAFDEHFGGPGQRRRFMEACQHLSNHDMAIMQTAMSGSGDADDFAGMATEIENPARAADALLMLEDDLTETKDTNFLLFLLALLRRDNVGKKMNRSRILDWEYPLLENRKTPPEFIQFIWDHNKNGRYSDVEWYQSPRSVAKHPNCPLSVLKELVKSDDAPLRLAVARHRNIDDALTNQFLNSTRLPEREQIAKSRYVTAEALLSMMRDKHQRVRQIAGKQFAKRFPDIEVTKEAIEQAVKARIEKPYVEPENPKPRFDMYADCQMGAEHILSLKPAQRASVAKIVRELDVLIALADDKSALVRRIVATRRDVPDDVLERYLTDTDFTVVSKTLLNLARRRTGFVFEGQAPQNEVDASYELLNTYLNQKGGLMPTLEKTDSKTEAEIERAGIVVQFSNNPMIQMRVCNDLAEIPDRFTVRWGLLKALSDNLHLTESMIRKIAFELEYGSEKVLLNCQAPTLVQEYLARDRIPGGVRGRLEDHLQSLQSKVTDT
jgi:hypothetical protein